MTEPPDIAGIQRPYGYDGDCPVTRHLEDIIGQAMADGACPILHPTKRQVDETLMIQGITVEDALGLTAADVKQAIFEWTKVRRAKGPSKNVRWSLGWLRYRIQQKLQDEWEARKASERKDAATMSADMRQLTENFLKTDPYERTKTWWRLMTYAEREVKIDEIRDKVGKIQYETLAQLARSAKADKFREGDEERANAE